MSVQDCDFKNAKVYKIVDNTSDMFYVGSTCRTLENRLKGHESAFKTYQKGKKTRCLTSYKILINKNYKIELLENFPCENSKQLLQREGYYIQQNICVNKYLPCRTQSQYKIDNAENVAIKNKEYKIKNADLIKLKGAKYYLKNKERMISQNNKPLD